MASEEKRNSTGRTHARAAAKPLPHPASRSIEEARAANRASKRVKEVAKQGPRETPSSALGPRRPATGSPGATAAVVAAAKPNGRETPRSALGPQRPAGGSEGFLSGIGSYVAGNWAANQKRWEDTVKAGKDVGAAKPSPQSAEAGTPTVPRAAAPGLAVKPRGDNTRSTPASTPAKKSTPARTKPRNVDNREVAPRSVIGAPPAKPNGAPRQIHPTAKVGSRDVAALRARSKASLADSQASAAARRSGGGGGAESVLQSYRGNKSHFTKREK